MQWKRFLFLGWCALTLATLFFYPLIATLYDNLWYLQWGKRHTYELILAYVLLTMLVTLILWWVGAIRQTRLKCAVLFLVGLVPMMSLGIQIIRQMGLTYVAMSIGAWVVMHTLIAGGLIIIVFSVFVVWLYARPRQLLRFGITVVLILSPLNLFAFWTIGTVKHFSRGTIQKPLVGFQSALPNTYLFLFDELSYGILYDEDGRIRAEFPNISALSSISDNYHAAQSPEADTLHSIPKTVFEVDDESDILLRDGYLSLFDGKGSVQYLRERDTNLFSEAKQKGYTTAVFGPYLRYCGMLKDYVDLCHSYSVYNYATVRERFSLLNPVVTNMILWPHQLPYGWVMRPLYTQWQKRGIAQTYQWTTEAFRLSQPAYLFTHFYIPHLPFVFDRDGFNPARNPFFQSDENYIRQVQYVDTLVGKLNSELKKLGKFDNSTIMLFSDHNFRIRFPDRQQDIVLMIKRPNQAQRKDIRDPMTAAEVLQEL